MAYCNEAAVDKKELVLNFYLSIHIQLYRVCVIKKMDFESLAPLLGTRAVLYSQSEKKELQ